jgi:RNA polymerase sigma-70 factor (ECF subfamily)
MMSGSRDRDDAELLRAAAAGQAEAFGDFYDRYVDAVTAYFATRTRDREAAADLTAETFAVALRAVRRYRPELWPPGAWIFTIAKHQLIDAQRRGRVADRARRRLGMTPLELHDADLERVEELADLAAARGDVLALVEGLPPDQRQAIEAHVIGERGYHELAEELRCSPSVVRQRVSRGLRTLRSSLREEEG